LGVEVEGTLSVEGVPRATQSTRQISTRIGREDSRGSAVVSITAKEVHMSCLYFKDSHFAICVAFESIYVPNIKRMETYCFSDEYRLCPNLATYLSDDGMNPVVSRDDETVPVRRL